MELTTKEIKKKHSSRPVGGSEMGSCAESFCSKAVASGPGRMADCGARWARLQLANEAAAGGPSDRLSRAPAQGDKASNL